MPRDPRPLLTELLLESPLAPWATAWVEPLRVERAAVTEVEGGGLVHRTAAMEVAARVAGHMEVTMAVAVAMVVEVALAGVTVVVVDQVGILEVEDLGVVDPVGPVTTTLLCLSR